jgi:hypothetical protein
VVIFFASNPKIKLNFGLDKNGAQLFFIALKKLKTNNLNIIFK